MFEVVADSAGDSGKVRGEYLKTKKLAVHAHVVDQGRGEERPESTRIREVLTYAPSLQPFAPPPARLYISALHLDPHTW